MNAVLTHHDRWLESPATDEPMYDDADIIEQMAEEPDVFDSWLSDRPCPPSVAGLLSLIVAHGLPLKNGTERDDELWGRYETLIAVFESEWREWATAINDHGASPVHRWRERHV